MSQLLPIYLYGRTVICSLRKGSHISTISYLHIIVRATHPKKDIVSISSDMDFILPFETYRHCCLQILFLPFLPFHDRFGRGRLLYQMCCREVVPISAGSSHLCHPFPFSSAIILYDVLLANRSSVSDSRASSTVLIGFHRLVMIAFLSSASRFRAAFAMSRTISMYSNELPSEPRRQYSVVALDCLGFLSCYPIYN